jgi:hypothetical protein
VLGAFLVALPIVLAYLLVEFWPTQEAGSDGTIPDATISLLGFVDFTMDPELQLIIVVMVSAGIGSYVHAATSFATYVGNRQLLQSWMWWYLLRGFIGVGLALIFYFALRGGLLTTGAGAEDVNSFGVAALAGLAGMFSKQATDKLREVFEVLFQTQGDEERADKLRA